MAATRCAGFAGGADVEYHFTPTISGRAEVLHYGFDEELSSVPGGNIAADTDITAVRCGISSKLN